MTFLHIKRLSVCLFFAGIVAGCTTFSQFENFSLPVIDTTQLLQQIENLSSTVTPTPFAGLPAIVVGATDAPLDRNQSIPLNAANIQPVAVVEVVSANLRSGPSTDYSLAVAVLRDARLPIIGEQGSGEERWYRVQKANGDVAWIWSALVSVYSSTSNVQIASTSVSAPVEITQAVVTSPRITVVAPPPTTSFQLSSAPIITNMSHDGTCEGFSLYVEWQDRNGDAEEISIAAGRSTRISGNGGIYEWTGWGCEGDSCTAITTIRDMAGNISEPYTYVVECS
jgi:SH3-like domain-containing protein